jgi:hypothetical protein
MDRKGEKIGWTGGWLGGFVWVFILAVVFLFQGKLINGILGLLLVFTAVLSILFYSPWRHPSTSYGKLMLGPYTVFFVSIAWAVWSYGGVNALGLNCWNLLWLLPLLIPFGTLSKRTWSDDDKKQEGS